MPLRIARKRLESRPITIHRAGRESPRPALWGATVASKGTAADSSLPAQPCRQAGVCRWGAYARRVKPPISGPSASTPLCSVPALARDYGPPERGPPSRRAGPEFGGLTRKGGNDLGPGTCRARCGFASCGTNGMKDRQNLRCSFLRACGFALLVPLQPQGDVIYRAAPTAPAPARRTPGAGGSKDNTALWPEGLLTVTLTACGRLPRTLRPRRPQQCARQFAGILHAICPHSAGLEKLGAAGKTKTQPQRAGGRSLGAPVRPKRPGPNRHRSPTHPQRSPPSVPRGAAPRPRALQ